jgi:hypothetical protein
MSETEMGNKVTKTTTRASEPVREVEVVLPSTLNTIYTLQFTGNVVRWQDHKEVRSSHVRHARDDLQNYHDWDQWLGNTMRDAIVNECEKVTGKTVRLKSDPAVTDIVLKLDPRVKRTGFSTEHTRISGTISWRSIPTDSASLKAAIEWRLGDRMAMYGLQDEDERWSYIFSPGEVTSEKSE